MGSFLLLAICKEYPTRPSPTRPYPETFASVPGPRKLVENSLADGSKEVVGVEYLDGEGALHTLMCDAVILTTGGFGFDHSTGSLMQQYRPDLVGVPTTNGSFATGDGMRFGAEETPANERRPKSPEPPTYSW